MKKQAKVFRETYQIDKSTHRYMIQVGVNDYNDLFSKWDPSAFHHREIDLDLENYLEKYSDEIPSEYPVELYIEILFM